MKRLSFSLAAFMLAVTPVSLAQAKQNCPPGLAKKNPPCVPPGQAKKAGKRSGDREEVVRTRRSDDRRDRWSDRFRDHGHDDYYREPAYVLGSDGRLYEVGDVLHPDDYVLVRVEDLLVLPLVDEGHTYVRAGGKVVEMVETTGQIIRTIGAIHDLLN